MRIKIESIYTEWFPIVSGIRQGDFIAPTMFYMYVNDLALDIKNLDLGIPLTNNETVALGMVADDIALLANSPSELQTMISNVSDWCECWQLFINTAKTHVIHFRASQTPLTDITFRYRDKLIEKLDRVRHSGMEMNEHVNLEIIANTLSDATSRALGALTAKYYQMKGMTFEV